jgi:hypothetical protein
MALSTIGWVVIAAMVTVIVIALALARLVFPREIFQPPPRPEAQEKPLPPGVTDLKEHRRGEWR